MYSKSNMNSFLKRMARSSRNSDVTGRKEADGEFMDTFGDEFPFDESTCKANVTPTNGFEVVFDYGSHFRDLEEAKSRNSELCERVGISKSDSKSIEMFFPEYWLQEHGKTQGTVPNNIAPGEFKSDGDSTDDSTLTPTHAEAGKRSFGRCCSWCIVFVIFLVGIILGFTLTLKHLQKPKLFTYTSKPPPAAAFPLGMCEGDCDFDSDCAEGLYCYQRDGGERVPGCSGPLDRSKTDFCAPVPSPIAKAVEASAARVNATVAPGDVFATVVLFSEPGASEDISWILRKRDTKETYGVKANAYPKHLYYIAERVPVVRGGNYRFEIIDQGNMGRANFTVSYDGTVTAEGTSGWGHEGSALVSIPNS